MALGAAFRAFYGIHEPIPQAEGRQVKILVATIALAALACGSDSSGPASITLNLTSVDGMALPRTLPSGNGTVQVLAGRLVGSHTGPACSWYLTFSSTGESFGSVPSCTVDVGDMITLTFDLGGPPSPSGSHSYRFGP